MGLHNSIKIIEPLWGKHAMIAINGRVSKHDILVKILPWSADIFVFTYPVYLVGLYLRGVAQKKEYFKYAAFAIATSAAVAAITNQVIQYFGDKSRPETAIAIQENLILSHLPTDPFPSDHAAVSAAIAMSTLLWGLKYKDKKFLAASVFFWFASGVMCFSRVAVAIHWPTDILVGILVGVCSALLVFWKPVRAWLSRYVFGPLMQVQSWLFAKLGWFQ